MKACELHGLGRENLKLADKPAPAPWPTEVPVQLSVVSLNYRDKLLVEGLYNPALQFSIPRSLTRLGRLWRSAGK